MSGAEPSRLATYLDHILLAIDNILEYTAGLDAGQYFADRKTQDAVVRNLEVIGEACNNVLRRHPDFAAAHPGVPWKPAYEMRNALAHGYFTVDHQIVWNTITQDLPGVRAAVATLRKQLPS